MKLEDLFKKYKDKQFYFIKGIICGNQGDDLICYGANVLADKIGLKYTYDLKLEINEEDIIYIHGSGGIGMNYSRIPFIVFILQNMFPNNKIIVGPSTYTLDPQLKLLFNNKNVTLFAREETSYDYLKSLNINVENVFLDKCTAFNLTNDCFEIKTESKIEKVLLLREDPESIKELPEEIKKLKEERIIYVDPCNYKTFKEWLLIHYISDKIYTNRLHSAILGVIMKKEVVMFHNHYHKNHSVWEYCLKDLGVKWVGKKWEVKEGLPEFKEIGCQRQM